MPLLKSTMVAEAHERKKKVLYSTWKSTQLYLQVFIYTVDSMYVSKWLECLGVDAIISNNPEKLLVVAFWTGRWRHSDYWLCRCPDAQFTEQMMSSPKTSPLYSLRSSAVK